MLVIMTSVIGIYQGLTMIRLASISLRAVFMENRQPCGAFFYMKRRALFFQRGIVNLSRTLSLSG